MNNYLLDQETLGQFVDELLKKKMVKADNPEELEQQRSKLMEELDNRISVAIFGTLDEKQLDGFDAMVDKGEESPEAYEKFFKDNNVDVQKIMTETFQSFAEEFLGGKNA